MKLNYIGAILICCLFAAQILHAGPEGKSKIYALDGTSGLEKVHVEATAVEYKGQSCVRLTSLAAADNGETLAILSDTSLKDGTIEFEVSGAPQAGAAAAARGFVGLAFRLQKTEPLRYECFYLRPTNGRAEDQLRRNHSAQYISHPDYTWSRLRQENPGVYESYVDLQPGEWTKVRIVIKGLEARLYVHGADQPCLIVKALKQGEIAGAVALWIGPGTVAHFRNLSITLE